METRRNIGTIQVRDFDTRSNPTTIKILVAINIATMVLLAWQWFQLEQALDSLSSYERATMSDSLRTNVGIYMYGLPILIAISGVLAVGIWKLKNWARLVMRGLNLLALVSGAYSLFNGGLNLILVLNIGLAIYTLVLLKKPEVEAAFMS
jgi:hypothetical protein